MLFEGNVAGCQPALIGALNQHHLIAVQQSLAGLHCLNSNILQLVIMIKDRRMNFVAEKLAVAHDSSNAPGILDLQAGCCNCVNVAPDGE